MSKRRGSLLGRAKSVGERTGKAIEKASGRKARSSVAIDPRLFDRLGDAAHFLGRSIADLSSELISAGLDHLAGVQPAAVWTAEAKAGSVVGGHIAVDISRRSRSGGGRPRRTSITVLVELRERIASEAFRLRRTQKDLVEETVRDGLNALREAEAKARQDERFDWPRRPKDARGKRWK